MSGTDEGNIFWMETEALRASPRLSANFDRYLPLFLEGDFSELFFEWDGASWDGVPQYFRFRKESIERRQASVSAEATAFDI